MDLGLGTRLRRNKISSAIRTGFGVSGYRSPVCYLWVNDALHGIWRNTAGLTSVAVNVAVKQGRSGIVVRAKRLRRLVGVGGIEPPTSWSQTRRASAALHPGAIPMIRRRGFTDKGTPSSLVVAYQGRSIIPELAHIACPFYSRIARMYYQGGLHGSRVILDPPA